MRRSAILIIPLHLVLTGYAVAVFNIIDEVQKTCFRQAHQMNALDHQE